MLDGRSYHVMLKLCVLFVAIGLADFRRLRSVDKTVDAGNPLLNSVEFIWGTTTVAVGDTAVLHCSFDAIFQQLRTGSIDWVKEETGRSGPTSAAMDNADDPNLTAGVIESSTAPKPVVVKIASGKQVIIDDRRYRVYRPHNSALSVLIIRRSKRQDAGIYRCNLSGSSTRHKYMILNVTESKIEAQTSPAKTVAKVGTDVTLWCNASGYPKPVVYWTREDRNRKLPDGNQQFWGNELHFEKVTEADTGIYTCYLDNFVQPVVSYKFSLMVEDNPWNVEGSKMRFDSSQWYRWDSPEPRPVRHKSYLLLCETRGSPKPLPTIQWYRDGKPLRSSKHFYIIEDTPEWRSSYTSSTLVIMRFMTEFQGNYTCVASNAFRMKKQTFYLSEILSAPEDKPLVAPQGGAQNGRPAGSRPTSDPGRLHANNIPPAAGTRPGPARKAPSRVRGGGGGGGGGEERTNVRQATEERNKMAAAALNVTRTRQQVTSQRRTWPTTASATEVTSPGMQSLKVILAGSGKVGSAATTSTAATAAPARVVAEDDGGSGNGNDQDPDSTDADD